MAAATELTVAFRRSPARWLTVVFASVIPGFICFGGLVATSIVRNYFRSYRIAWQDIAAFEMPPRYGTFRNAGLRIHLLNGRVISATLYARGRVDSGRAARTVVEELEQLRRQGGPSDQLAPGPA